MELRDIIEAAADNDPRQWGDWPPQRPVTSAELEERVTEEDLTRQLAAELADQREPFRFSPRATAMAERLFNSRVRQEGTPRTLGADLPGGSAIPADMATHRFRLQTTPPPAVTFDSGPGDTPVLQFMQDGRIYIRGQLVDDNQEVYAALLNWMQASGHYPQDRHREGLNKPEPQSEPPEPGRSRFDILREGQP